MSRPDHQVEKLSKLLTYVLGRRPDEFGLVPDEEGYVGIKELLQALHEEPGWRHIRAAHINEALITLSKPAACIEGNRIRACDRSLLPVPGWPEELPKLLYTAVRPRAYPVALDNGLAPAQNRRHLILAKDKAMALRIGQRYDNNPTLLTIQVAATIIRGTSFRQYGSLLFLADMIDAGAITGPALPKEKPAKPINVEATETRHSKTPGSYFPHFDTAHGDDARLIRNKRRKEPDWQKSRRQARRHKANLNK